MARETLVEERVTRSEQLEHAAILAQHVLEQQLGLAPKRGAQLSVETGVLRQRIVELAQLEPLRGEVLDERGRARVGEHAPHLPLERDRLVQPARGRGGEQLVVGNAAPKKKRQARRELEIADAVARAGRHTFGLSLEPIEEPRIDEQARERLLDARLEIAVAPALLVEAQQRAELGAAGIHGPPIRVRRESGQDLARARNLVSSHRRGTAEDGPPARRSSYAGRSERPVDLDGGDAAARRVDAE